METYSEEEHRTTHDSINDPISGCEYCKYEIYRRTHKCFGEGSSSVAIPPPIDKE